METPDSEVMITCEREIPFYNRYRPTHLIKEDYLTIGVHQYQEIESIQPNHPA